MHTGQGGKLVNEFLFVKTDGDGWVERFKGLPSLYSDQSYHNRSHRLRAEPQSQKHSPQCPTHQFQLRPRTAT
jgi:hypothetical protein